jgi:hypothetical protein
VLQVLQVLRVLCVLVLGCYVLSAMVRCLLHLWQIEQVYREHR